VAGEIIAARPLWLRVEGEAIGPFRALSGEDQFFTVTALLAPETMITPDSSTDHRTNGITQREGNLDASGLAAC
jgi:hypothetical protein